MNRVFLILGYGIPKNIHRDDNYRRYLSLVFNTIFEASRKDTAGPAQIIFCGGPTDMYKPYRRTEAAEMEKFFRASLRKLQTQERRNFTLHQEKKSLSTLENLVFTKSLLSRKRIKTRQVTVFCEYTRHRRISVLGKNIFGSTTVRVVPIDFDTSTNRYLDPKFLAAKESKVLKFDLWALENSKNFARWHNLFVEKIAFLRSIPPKRQVRAIEQWWRIQFRTLKTPRSGIKRFV